MNFTQFLRRPQTAFSVFKCANARNALEESLEVLGIAHVYGIDKTKEALSLSQFEEAVQKKDYAAHFNQKRPLLNFINAIGFVAESNKGIFEFMCAAAKVILATEDVLIYQMLGTKYSIVTEKQLTNEQCTALNLFADLFFSLLKSNKMHPLQNDFDANELKGTVVFDSIEAGLNESTLIGFISVLNLFRCVNFVFLGGFAKMVEFYLDKYSRNRRDIGIYNFLWENGNYHVSENSNVFLGAFRIFDANSKLANTSIPTQIIEFDNYRYIMSYTTFGNLIELTTDIERAKHFSSEVLSIFANNFELAAETKKSGMFLQHKIVNPSRYNGRVVVVPF